MIKGISSLLIVLLVLIATGIGTGGYILVKQSPTTTISSTTILTTIATTTIPTTTTILTTVATTVETTIETTTTVKILGEMTIKNEYDMGEQIDASVVFNHLVYTDLMPWEPFKYQNGEWEPVSWGIPCLLPCLENQTSCGMEMGCAPGSGWSGCRELNATELKTWSWDQRISKSKTIECTVPATNQTINWECYYIEYEPGDYKLRFSYTVNCPVPNEFGKDTTIEYLEREFKISH